jgi:hypothetical protein
MASAYHPEVWRDLFAMVGAAAAALIGLLFIVMSLHVNATRGSLDYDMTVTINTARNNTYHLLAVLVTSVLVLAPQPPEILGIELVFINLFGLRLPIFFMIKHSGRFHLSITLPIGGGYLLGAAGGITLMTHPSWGLYLVAASCVILLVRTVLTAWTLMFERRPGVAAAEEG